MKNGLRNNSCLAVLWILISSFLHVFLFRAKVSESFRNVQGVVIIIVTIACTLIVHEVIHWCAARLLGLKKTKIMPGKSPLGFPTLLTVFYEKSVKWKWIIIFVMPFIVLSMIPDILFLFSERIAYPLFFMVVGNSAGCYFDLVEVIHFLFGKNEKEEKN